MAVLASPLAVALVLGLALALAPGLGLGPELEAGSTEPLLPKMPPMLTLPVLGLRTGEAEAAALAGCDATEGLAVGSAEAAVGAVGGA